MVQALCARVPQRAFAFAAMHAARLRAHGGLRGSVTVLRGLYSGEFAGDPSFRPPAPAASPPVAVFAGRHIAEKRVPALVPALAVARADGAAFCSCSMSTATAPTLNWSRQPSRPRAWRPPSACSASSTPPPSTAPCCTAACLALPSVREGYGLIVVEAAAHGCPAVVVDHPDNAAVELVVDGVNGIVAA